MTRDEQDKKEYEEFKALHQERYRLIPDWALKEFWLESRRLLNMRIKELEKENARLKKLVADLMLDKEMLKDLAEGNF